MRSCTIALIAGMSLTATCSTGAEACSGPTDPLKAPVTPTPAGVRPGVIDTFLVNDDFESYAAGSLIGGQGGWDTWWTTGPNTEVVSPAVCTALYATCPAGRSGSNSMMFKNNSSDIVQYWNGQWESGVYELTAYIYVPTSTLGTPGQAFVIALNTYTHQPGGGSEDWSIVTHFEQSFGLVVSDAAGVGLNASLPLLYDEWVEYKARIDLDNNTLEEWYDGQVLLGAGGPGGQTGTVQWYDPSGAPSSNGVSTDGKAAIECLDLWSNNADSIFIDDVVFVKTSGGCYPDCDGSGSLDLFDFLCFVNEFNSGNPYADCDGSGALDLFDFLCFVNAFNAGCP